MSDVYGSSAKDVDDNDKLTNLAECFDRYRLVIDHLRAVHTQFVWKVPEMRRIDESLQEAIEIAEEELSEVVDEIAACSSRNLADMRRKATVLRDFFPADEDNQAAKLLKSLMGELLGLPLADAFAPVSLLEAAKMRSNKMRGTAKDYRPDNLPRAEPEGTNCKTNEANGALHSS